MECQIIFYCYAKNLIRKTNGNMVVSSEQNASYFYWEKNRDKTTQQKVTLCLKYGINMEQLYLPPTTSVVKDILFQSTPASR